MPWSLLKLAFNKQTPLTRHFPKRCELKPEYDVVIVGGGGHGLAAAYYLAKDWGITNVAVLEKGYLAGGNTARNTTIIRSNYLTQEGVRFYDACPFLLMPQRPVSLQVRSEYPHVQ